MMKVAMFVEPGRIVPEDKRVPDAGPLDAPIRITTTTIRGTDVHILKGEYPVAHGQTIGHAPVGIVERPGSAVTGFREGQRVIAGAIAPSSHSAACQCGQSSQNGHGTPHGWKAMAGRKFGSMIDGAQAACPLVPDAMDNLAPVPDSLADEQVPMCPDIMSTGFCGAENGSVRIGDTVAIVAQGPNDLCATAGAKLKGTTTIIVVDTQANRPATATRLGADHVIDLRQADPVVGIMRLTKGRGVDVAIEASGTHATFESCTRVLGPGGSEDMRRLMAMFETERVDLGAMVTHRFKLDDIEKAHDFFSHQREGVFKVAIAP